MSVFSGAFRRRLRSGIAALTLVVFAAASIPLGPALADPPPWAPAHGWRAKHGERGYYQERDYRDYRVPYGIDAGHCNRDVLGAVLGGVAGGAIGAATVQGHSRTIAIVGGTILGALIGGVIGRSMDNVDQNCVGQTLEHARDGQEVRWRAPNGYDYEVVPRRTCTAGNGEYCREYTTTAIVNGRAQRVYGTACRNEDGSWRLVS